MTSVRIIGPGRAGTSLALALTNLGWEVAPMLGRGDDPADAAAGVQFLIIATPDDVVAEVAASVDPVPTTVVAHLSGSRGLAELEPHPRRAALHPLVALPTPELGSRHMVGAWFAVAGDKAIYEIVDAVNGRSFSLDDDERALYHATACVAANHLVALMGQVERLARAVDVPVQAYLELASSTLANVEVLGAHKALTGPAARGDQGTLDRHLEALPADERPTYEAMVAEAKRLAAQPPPPKPRRVSGQHDVVRTPPPTTGSVPAVRLTDS
jgi:predicted short-subunit dehydrogenase-like oxidoreductase (DUF2520 family)